MDGYEILHSDGNEGSDGEEGAGHVTPFNHVVYADLGDHGDLVDSCDQIGLLLQTFTICNIRNERLAKHIIHVSLCTAIMFHTCTSPCCTLYCNTWS